MSSNMATQVLDRLINTIKSHPTLHQRGSGIQVPPRESVKPTKSDVIKQGWFWQACPSTNISLPMSGKYKLG